MSEAGARAWVWENEMSGAVDFSAGGFRFLPSVFQFSAGVAALPAMTKLGAASAAATMKEKA